MTKLSLRYFASIAATVMLIVGCTPETQLQNSNEAAPRSPVAEDALQIWWDKGYNPEEDEALEKLIENWEQKTGNEVQVNFYTLDKRSEKPQRYLQNDIVPDIFMSFKAESTLNASLAWSGKLADISDLVEPVKEVYDSAALQTAYYYNNVSK